MRYKGVIFDFNGTVFWDTHLHNQAWDRFLANHSIFLSDEDKNDLIHGKNNQDIFRDLLGRQIEQDEMNFLIHEKESIYQQLCKREGLKLAPGVVELFDFLVNKKIPFTIATASGKENMRFYFEYLNLTKWFNWEDIVYNDGSFKGKPEPDIFNIAASKLRLHPEELVVFEDSANGIKAAENAGSGKIIIINSVNSDYSAWPHDIITSFNQFDRDILKIQ